MQQRKTRKYQKGEEMNIMKKAFFSIVVVMLLMGTHAFALPFITDDSVVGTAYTFTTTDGFSYTVTNQKQIGDSWDSTYGGYTGDNFTGYYLGTITSEKNNSEEGLTRLLNYYLGTESSYDFIKVDAPDQTNGSLSVTYSDDKKSGNWSTSGTDPAYNVSFYSVKGATDYALYFVDPSEPDGTWTSGHLLTQNGNNIPTISHLTVATDSPAPVPEPATMLLFGTGLAGLAGLARRRKKT